MGRSNYLPGALARVFYQYFPFLVILWSVGLPTEWNRWVFPIRSMLLPRLIHPMGFVGSPFLLDPESIPRVVKLSFRSSIVGKKLYVGNLTYNVNESDLEALFTPFGSVQSATGHRRSGHQPLEGVRIRGDGVRRRGAGGHPGSQRS